MKKLLCLLLAALMLFSMVACATGGDDPSGDGTKDQGTQNEEVTADPNYTCDLPSDLNFKDATIGILYDFDMSKMEFYHDLPTETRMLMNSLWEDLKIESTIGIAIYVICGVIVAFGLALLLYNFIVKRSTENVNSLRRIHGNDVFEKIEYYFDKYAK